MTQEEQKLLSEMTCSDRIRKYNPLYLKGDISFEVYQYVLRFKIGKVDREEVTPEAFLSAFGGVSVPEDTMGAEPGVPDAPRVVEESALQQSATNHPSASTGRSQKVRILDVLSDGRSHDTVEIMERAYKIDREKAGNCNIKARIDDLRNDGYIIPQARRVRNRGKGVFGYVLLGKQKEPYRVSDPFKQIADNFGAG
jgi:hypothetical protein